MTGPAAEVLANLKGKLEGFQEHLPLIKALRNPGLRDRHWDKISQSKVLASAEHTYKTLIFFLLFLQTSFCMATQHYIIAVPGMQTQRLAFTA